MRKRLPQRRPVPPPPAEPQATNPQLRAAGVAYLVLGSPEYQLA